jgi:hypothetical protein
MSTIDPNVSDLSEFATVGLFNKRVCIWKFHTRLQCTHEEALALLTWLEQNKPALETIREKESEQQCDHNTDH